MTEMTEEEEGRKEEERKTKMDKKTRYIVVEELK